MPRPRLQLFHAGGNLFVPEPLNPSNSGSRTANATAAAYDVRSEMFFGEGRAPYPGPASVHRGGWNSAYHTPLPVGMMQGGGGAGRNSWRDDDDDVEGERRGVGVGGRGFTVKDV